MIDKQILIRVLCELLDAEITRATEAANQTRADAVHEEARPENDKDTRALEQTYLARGQAQRVVDLQSAQTQVKFMDVRAFGPDDEIGVSALVSLQHTTTHELRWYFLAPAAGGRRVTVEGTSVDVITPEAPLGRALTGRLCDDELTLRAGGRQNVWLICEVY